MRNYESIAVERRGRVLVLRLNRPEVLNAVDEALHIELSHVFRDAAEDPDSDVIVLTGTGKAFSAGGDIEWMERTLANPRAFDQVAAEAKTIAFDLIDLEKPIICGINGHCFGLGATLALLCDVVIASETTKIGDPHVIVGLSAGDGGALIWPALIGYAKAKYYLMTGDHLTATEAERIGLISLAVPAEDFEPALFGLADRLAAGATYAIRATKVTANLPLRQIIHSYFDAGVALEQLSSRSAEHVEGVRAFREKRPPNYANC